MKKLSRIIFSSSQKKLLFLQSLFFVWVIRLILWIFPYKRLDKWLSRFDARVRDNNVNDWIIIKSVVRSVRLCSRYVPYASCLTQALATQTILKLKGQSSSLKIGVEKDEDGKLAAHAWVEIEGKIIIGKLRCHSRFNVLTYSNSIIV